MHAQVARDIATGRIVCPVSRSRLERNGDVIEAGTSRYRILGGVPLLLRDEAVAAQYVESSAQMVADYSAFERPGLLRRVARLSGKEYRSPQSIEAFRQLFADTNDDATIISVGGGPNREHPALVNVNIGPFPNVDLVADAVELPYADESVDGIYCEAVLEHLRDPHAAVAEMSRVLRRGGKVFAATPFMQPFHGYPNHFQNYTKFGQVELLRQHGFVPLESGVAIGPAFALVTIVSTFLSVYSPRVLGLPLRALWFLLKQAIMPLDIWLTRRPNAHVLASLTYVLAQKP